MFIKGPVTFKASLDDGLTVTTFLRDTVHEVPDWVGAMAIEHYQAKEVKDKAAIAAAKEKAGQ